MIPAAVVIVDRPITDVSGDVHPILAIGLVDVQVVASSFAFEDDEMALPFIGGGITSTLLAAYRLCRSYQDSAASQPDPEDVRVNWTDMDDPPEPDDDDDRL